MAVKIGCVLMAAGFSARFGANKLLHQVEGTSLYQRAFAACPARLFRRAAVVSQYDEILEDAAEAGYLPLPNLDAAQGQSASIRLGLSFMGDCDGVLFAVCDQPWLRVESVKKLVAAFQAAPDRITALSWQGERGNPVIVPRDLFPALAALTGDTGGGTVIRAHPQRLTLVECGEGRELEDVDTP